MIKSDILKNIDNGPGFLTFKLSKNDYKTIHNLVDSQFRRNLKRFHPKIINTDICEKIEEYHKLDILDHKSIWTKERRTLEEIDIPVFKKTDFIKSLVREFDGIKITNEDDTRSEEIYWRLVRPGIVDDIGPLHADSWFWDLQNGAIEKSYRRIKVWISIYNQSKKNGLRVLPFSQKIKYEFKGEIRDGKMKPVYDEKLEFNADLKNIPTNPGDLIMFHDDLIHGGFIGGDKTRISIEFTFLVKK